MRRDDTLSPELKEALCRAMEWEYADLPDPETLEYDYTFSPEFEERMKKIIPLAGYTYVSVGRHRLRRAVAIALIAIMIFAMTTGAIAIQRAYVKWNENNNEDYGTMDVTFDIDDPNQTLGEFRFMKPETPKGYTMEAETKYGDVQYEIQYTGQDGTLIYYFQSGDVASMGLGIDNEDAELEEIVVNGFKGYSYIKKGNAGLFWSDGISLYRLLGTCELSILEEMAASIK